MKTGNLFGLGQGNILSGLSPKGTGQQLFSDPEEEKHKKIDSAFDTIRKKYGDDALRRGT
jgi:hypothetical protein